MADLNPFPWQLDLIALILGIIGTALGVMALPSVFQALWGGARLSIEFSTDRDSVPPAKAFLCQIFNLPVRGHLRRLHVRRETASQAIAHFSIREAGTKRIVMPGNIPDIKTGAGVTAQNAALPASFFPATFVVAFAREEDGVVEVKTHGDGEDDLVLPPGEYEVIVELTYGEQSSTGIGRLVLGRTMQNCFWSQAPRDVA